MVLSIMQISKHLGIQHNVMFRVIDLATNKVVSEHVGHNQATDSMLSGIAHYLKGDGVLNQGASMLSNYVPKYISLGTMGLINQDEDEEGLPAGIGVTTTGDNGVLLSESERFTAYMQEVPGYGADGYDENLNNNRMYAGLGPMFPNRDTATSDNPMTVRCELISNTYPRSPITYRQILPETEAELPETIDIVYSAMVSTGALAQFRETIDGKKRDYVFITEAGLWSRPDWVDSSNNGLLAGYRIVPPDAMHWDMTVPQNRDILKHQILKVRTNQVVQVIWKLQLGAIDQFHNQSSGTGTSYWPIWYEIH